MKAHFMDFELETGGVAFHPRPETELLVEKALEIFSPYINNDIACNILDVCTGSGNIAISLTKYIPSSRIIASDISDTAIRVAKENARQNDADRHIQFIKSDLFAGIGEFRKGFFDLIISNPPYISLPDFSVLPEEVKRDPYIALYGGTDGMDFQRRLASDSSAFLKKGGFVLFEVGYDQAEKVKSFLETSGEFCDIEIYKDYSRVDRIVKARKNG